MGRKNKKNKSPAPAAPPQPPVDDKELITEAAANPLEKNEKKLMNDLSKRYPQVKERVSLKQQAKKNKKKSGSSSSSPNTSGERRSKSSGKSRSLSQDGRKVYRQRTPAELKEAEFGWKNVDTAGSLPPSDYTVTNVNQNHDLLVN
jgi:hypothetical protein